MHCWSKGRLRYPEQFGNIVVRESRKWRNRARERRGAGGAGPAGLQHDQPSKWKAHRNYCHLPAAPAQSASTAEGIRKLMA